MSLTEAQVIEYHSDVCLYRGSGSTRRKRPVGVDHKGKGAYKYISENQRVKNCAKHLYRWCKTINIEPVITWQELAEDQKPNNAGRCVKGTI